MIVKMNNIRKIYKDDSQNEILALDNLSLEIKKGEKIIIVGESGAGKSTLLNIITMLDVSFEGKYEFNGRNIHDLKKSELQLLRNEEFGFLFQDDILVEEDSVYENVEIPLLYSKKFKHNERFGRINDVLNWVELNHLSNKKVKNLSGGERKRVAIARALVNNPDTLILDEPSGSLDIELSNRIMKYIYDYVNEANRTMIMVTHDLERVKQDTCRVLELVNGLIKKE